MQYRPEIDGLRAIAVMAVILSHAGFALFSGGFVGVDIFFVISGYLITTIILSELEAGTFSLLRFYEKRARRILPALFLVCVASIVVAWFLFLPEDMRDLSKSVYAVSTFTSNFHFWQEIGYFNRRADLKPLLHTWSLAVEEQYYILFPFVLMISFKLGKAWLAALFMLLISMSLGGAYWWYAADADAVFYLLPARMWELLTGGLVALVLYKRQAPVFGKIWNQLLSLIGLICIFYSIMAFNGTIPYRNLGLVMPALGAAFIILCANDKTAVYKLLSHRALVAVGLISYSAYLWHQPLFAFARYYQVSEPAVSIMLLLSLATLILAYLSWRFVEQPLRNRQKISSRTIVVLSVICTSSFIVFGVKGEHSRGFEKEWMAYQPAARVKLYQMIMQQNARNILLYHYRKPQDNGDCRFNTKYLPEETMQRILGCYQKYGKGVVILGDSHAIDLYSMATLASDKSFIIGVTKSSCHLPAPVPSCKYDELLLFVRKHPDVFSRIIYENAGYRLLRTKWWGAGEDIFDSFAIDAPIKGVYPYDRYIREIFDYLKMLAKNVPVLWLGPRIEPRFQRHDVMTLGCNHAYHLRENHYAVFNQLDEAIANVVSTSDRVAYISQNKSYDIIFPRDYIDCDHVYWLDDDHLSEDGERLFSKRFDIVDYAINHAFKASEE